MRIEMNGQQWGREYIGLSRMTIFKMKVLGLAAKTSPRGKKARGPSDGFIR